MVFSSGAFLFLFLPIVVLGVLLLGKAPTVFRIRWLLCCSLFFYGYWEPRLLWLLGASIAGNYGFGRAIQRSDRRRTWLYTGVAFNLGLIAWFKYAGFFAETLNALLKAGIPIPHVILPLGISFFTFQQIAYLVDVSVDGKAERSLLRYAFFVAFFPQLIAGPIVHHRHVLPFLREEGALRISRAMAAEGAVYFAIGLFKKVAIADTISRVVGPVFGAADSGLVPDMSLGILGVLGYSLQIYFDFSGYSDMAIGLGLLFGLRFPANFNSPYQARDFVEFWRRWHITLSEFLRDYVYIPLGGNRKGKIRRYMNLIMTMLLGGLWHGAHWNFVIWGGIHGVLLALNHLAYRFVSPDRLSRVGGKVASIVVMAVVSVIWIPFRATTFGGAGNMVRSLFGMGEGEIVAIPAAPPGLGSWWTVVTMGISVALFCPNSGEISRFYREAKYSAKIGLETFALTLFCVCGFYILYFSNRVTEFIYFNF